MKNQKFTKYLDLYSQRFKDNFPTMCFMGCSYDEMIEVMEECLDKNKDVYKLGYVDLNSIY